MKSTKEYKKGYNDGYHQCMHDHDIIHGKDAERFLANMKKADEQGPSKKQQKFLDECVKMFDKCQVKE